MSRIPKNYLLFWFSQSVSQLGSAMTAYALILWTYQRTGSAFSVSLLSFFTYLSYIAVSLFAGPFVDAHAKKPVLIWSDSLAAVCTLTVAALLLTGNLKLWHVYAANLIAGGANAFQNPASMVAVGGLVPEEEYARVSGLNSFSASLITVATPMLSTALYSVWGLRGVLPVDFATFLFAAAVLAVFIAVPETEREHPESEGSALSGCREGWRFLRRNQGLLYVVLSMALINFLSRLTYENILPAMILARSGGREEVLGLVSGTLGLGGILGGLMVSFRRTSRNCMKMIYFPAAFSFLFGDLLMGLGRDVLVWIPAALAASVPIPFLMAGQNVLLYRSVPKAMQGRVFAVRNAVQYFTIPIGILLGGILADGVFEPMMRGGYGPASFFSFLVGSGKGSGMAVMFLCTGVLGFLSSVRFYGSGRIQRLKREEDAPDGELPE